MKVIRKIEHASLFMHSAITAGGFFTLASTTISNFPLISATLGRGLILYGLYGMQSAFKNSKQIYDSTIEELATAQKIDYTWFSKRHGEDITVSQKINKKDYHEILGLECVVLTSEGSLFGNKTDTHITDGINTLECYFNEYHCFVPGDTIKIDGYLKNTGKDNYIKVNNLNSILKAKQANL